IAAEQAAARDDRRLHATIGQLSRWVLAVELPLVTLLALAPRTLLSIFGGSFMSGALWLAILAAAHGTSSFVGLAETVIVVERPGEIGAALAFLAGYVRAWRRLGVDASDRETLVQLRALRKG